MIISICIVAYNEEKYLGDLFKDILNQDYQREKTEIIMIDNGSTDSSGELMRSFAMEHDDFYSKKVITIKRSNLASACNEALKSFEGDIYVRVDAHARIAKDFLRRNVECIKSGEEVCGGSRPSIPDNNTLYQQALLSCESSLFGSSFASYRREHSKKQYLSSLFHVAVKRDVVMRCGGYNENLGRTEDNEFTYRLRKMGYKLCYTPSIKSYQTVRSTFSKMLRQKYLNGYWIGLTMGICPKCFSLFHFAPLCLVLGLVFCSLLALYGFSTALYLLCCAYVFTDIAITVSVFLSSKKFNGYNFLLPFFFLMLHLAYGSGTLIGLVKMPFWSISLRGNKYKGVNETRNILIEKQKPRV